MKRNKIATHVEKGKRSVVDQKLKTKTRRKLYFSREKTSAN